MKVQAPLDAMVNEPLPGITAVKPALMVPTPGTVKVLTVALALTKASLLRTLPVRTASSATTAESSTAPRLMTSKVAVAAEVTAPSVMT